MAITIETRGLSCPQPVIMVNNALNKKQLPITVLADSEVVIENISRFANSKGLTISKVEGDDIVSLTIEASLK